MDLIKIILALFLPPVAVFLQTGFSMHLLINIILTILFVLPGSVHALWVIVKKK